jgi:hypothetical protein
MLPDASSRVNTATVVTSTPKVQGGTATANVTFSSTPTTEIDKCITVSDNGTTLGSVCTDGSTTFCKKFIYTEPVKYDACGDYTYTNTASFVTDDKKVTGSASCSFKVKVPCVGGCTLTQGYWKTHSIYGPAPYDDTWAKIGENTPFFKSGYTYYSIMWVAPAGNAYFILAHQYIAAKLNILNGASTTTDVTAAIAGAEALFNAQGTNDVTFSAQERKSALIYATTLDNYNNGLIGPGHCSESNPKVQPLIAPNNQSQRFDVKETNNLIIYPTPANNEISINLSDYSGEQVDIEIYSTTAQLVLTKKIQEVANHIVPVNVSELAEGAYILSVKSLAHKPASKVLIIQR